MSKLSDYLTTNKIDPRRIALASKGVERHTREDLKLIAKKAAIKAGTAEKNPEISKAKPRSGRPVTIPQRSRSWPRQDPHRQGDQRDPHRPQKARSWFPRRLLSDSPSGEQRGALP